MHDDTPSNEPESLSPFLTTAPAVEAMKRLERGLGVRRPFLLVTGQPGTGRTTLAREAMRRWGERVTAAVLELSGVDAASLPSAMILAFGGAVPPGTPAFTLPERLMETLANATSGGRIAVLLVDGADALTDDELLELLRLALKAEQRQCPLEVFLVGAPALAQRIEREALKDLREMVSVRVTLEALSPHDTRHYLLQRPGASGGSTMFSRKACRDIHTASRGRLRDIEAIATEAARRAARANATTVSPEHVRAAAQAVRGRKPVAPANAAAAAEAPPAQAAPAPPAKATPAPAAKAAPAPASRATQPPAAKAAPASDAKAAPPAAAKASPAPAAKGAQAPGAKATPAPAAKATPASAAKAPEPPPAPAEPDPREAEPVAQGSHVDEEVSASAAASAPTDSGEFQPSNDPRVKDWISRFGGSGVRIGANYASSSARGLDFSDDSAGDVRPLGASAAESPTPSNPAPERASRAQWHEDAGAAEPVAWPPPASQRRGPVLGRRRDSPIVWQAATVVLALTLGLVLWGQRGLTPRDSGVSTAEVSPAESTDTDPIRARAPRPKRTGKRNGSSSTRQARTEAAQPGAVRYSVAVGTFLDVDMARAERDHLARLIRYRVWVNAFTVNRVKTYRIQFGAFETQAEAEEAAQKLLRQGLLRDASVVELPPAE